LYSGVKNTSGAAGVFTETAYRQAITKY